MKNPHGENTTAENPLWTILLSIFLSLILFELLSQFLLLEYGSVYLLLLHLSSFDEGPENWVPLMQFGVFAVFLGRFFAGSFRFHEEASYSAPKSSAKKYTFGTNFSLIATILMFSLLFLTAREVFSTDKFYFLLIAIHLVDLIWFAVIFVHLKFRAQLSLNNPSLYPVVVFLIYTIITLILVIGAILYSVATSERDVFEVLEADFSVMAFILFVVGGISVIDIIWMAGFYMNPPAFRSFLRQFDDHKVYLAGPEVFLADHQNIASAKKKMCAKYGFTGVFPTDNKIDASAFTRLGLAKEIAKQNEKEIQGADIVIANITPFRGVSLDVGTAYEIGFARALGKSVFAYTNASGDYLNRAKGLTELNVSSSVDEKGWFDGNKMLVEDFGMRDNLMIESAILDGGSEIKLVEGVGAGDLWTNLDGFEQCLKEAGEFVPSHGPMTFWDWFSWPYKSLQR